MGTKKQSKKLKKKKSQKEKLVAFFMAYRFSFAVIIVLILFISASFGLVLANGKTIQADDAHIVVINNKGQEQTILTRAVTVKDAIDRLGIVVGPSDLIEPALTKEIDVDNFKIQINGAVPTTIDDDGKLTSLLSPYKDVRLATEKVGLVLSPEDNVELVYPGILGQTDVIGRKIKINRAKEVVFSIYGSVVVKKTQKETVADLLKEMNVSPSPDDTLTPSPETKLTRQTNIFLTKVGQQLISTEEVIAFKTTQQDDSTLSQGTTKTKIKGVDGKKLVTYQLQLENGKEVSRKIIQETIISQPTDAVVLKGTKPLFADYNTDGIPARVFCGSPKQNNWKNINVQNAAVGRKLAEERGWTDGEFNALLELFACESSWNEKAGNPYSGAYGIPQSWPASKMASFGDDYMTNPVTQIRWGYNYIAGRYGTPSKALAFHYRTNYY